MKMRMDVIVVAGLALLVLGFLVGTLQRGPSSDEAHGDGQSSDVSVWTCSMHPQIQLPDPGKCPICSMDLIPVVSDGAVGAGGEARLSMSPAAMKLAEIQTTKVERRFPTMELHLVGKVEFDETRMRQISAWAGGRLDRLYVDYTGVLIREGDHLVEIYSPELIGAQEELIQALRASGGLAGSSARLLRDTAGETLDASREKLRLLGLKAEQIQSIEERGEVADHVTVYAPIDGIVIAKHAVQGSYVNTGEALYSIADLTHLWVKLDAYESDLVWLRYGQELSFTTEAYPGRVFTGRVSFIDPVLNPRTRTAKVRVNVANEDLLLKPEMFVRATVLPLVSSKGRVMAEELAGKWISPMHPEIIKDGPGSCDMCGMDLVRIEDMGYEALGEQVGAPLIIPATAALVTGRRAVVYVRVAESDRPTFEGREIVLGPRAGDHYIVESGLVEGERVVVNGAFKIDSAMQIQAKPSMMSPRADGGGHEGHDHGDEAPSMSTPAAFREQLGAVTRSYLQLTAALADDDLESARLAAAALPTDLAKVDMTLLEAEAHVAWMKILAALEPVTQTTAKATDMADLRVSLPDLTEQLAAALRAMGSEASLTVRRFHCPMAFDNKGGDWLQAETTTANPYYGASMLRCGSEVERLDVAEASGR